MRKRNKLLSLFLGALAIFSLISCGKEKEDKKDLTSTSEISTDVSTSTSTSTETSTSTSTSTSTNTSKSTSTSTSASTSTDTSTSTTTEIVDNVVDEEVFNSYFGGYDELTKLNIRISVDCDTEDGSVDLSSIIEISEMKALVTKEDKTDGSINKTYYNLSSFDEIFNRINYFEGIFNTSWSNVEQKSTTISRIRNMLMIPQISFDKVTYNESLGVYELDYIEIDEIEYMDVEIKFENDKLYSYDYKYATVDDVFINASFIVSSIGDVEFENPYPYITNSNIYDYYFRAIDNGLKDLNLTINYSIEDDNSDIVSGTIKIANQMILNSYLLKDGTSLKKIMKFNKFDEEEYEYTFDVSYCNQQGIWSDYSSEQYTDFNLSKYIFLPPFCPIYWLIYNYDTNQYEKKDIGIVDTDFDNIKIKFFNDKLVSIEYIENNVNKKATISNIGTTEVIDPRADIEE